MEISSQYEVKVEVLSPVHIGDGSELLRDIDYVIRQGQTWVVNQDALLERTLSEDGMFDHQLLGRPVSELLTAADFDQLDVFRYVMRGIPTNRPLRSHIKDVFGRPYLPGSSIKGLLRTTFVRGMYISRKQKPDLRYLGKSRSWAGQPVERKVMGATPNDDLFRAVRITDSDPVSLDRLRVAPVSIYPTSNRGGQGVVVDVEALMEETVFTARMTLDEYGFAHGPAAERLGWADKRASLNQLVDYARDFNRQRLLQEVEYYQAKQGPRRLLAFYNGLVSQYEGLQEGQFLAQIGWGAGWNSKTLNDLLTDDAQQFAKLVQTYRLTRFATNFSAGKVFPASRHLVLQGDEPVRPMGWVKVTLT